MSVCVEGPILSLSMDYPARPEPVEGRAFVPRSLGTLAGFQGRVDNTVRRPSACDDGSMPELPEVEAVRRQLDPVMRGARIARVELRRKRLRRPIPDDFASRVEGRTVRAIDRRGKYLLARLSSGDTVLVHLGMTGSFRVDP